MDRWLVLLSAKVDPPGARYPHVPVAVVVPELPRRGPQLTGLPREGQVDVDLRLAVVAQIRRIDGSLHPGSLTHGLHVDPPTKLDDNAARIVRPAFISG